MGVEIVDVDKCYPRRLSDQRGAMEVAADKNQTLTHVKVAFIVDESLRHAPAVKLILAQDRSSRGEGRDSNRSKHDDSARGQPNSTIATTERSQGLSRRRRSN